MPTSTQVADELELLCDLLRGPFEALAEQNPSLCDPLSDLRSRLGRAVVGNADAASVLYDLTVFLAQLDATKQQESETFANARREAQHQTRSAMLILLNSAMVA